ncbi:MAG: hypothetical protein V8R61_11215 [Enterocloster sp.]
MTIVADALSGRNGRKPQHIYGGEYEPAIQIKGMWQAEKLGIYVA